MEGGAPLCLKYIDNGLSINKINFETATRMGGKVRLKHAVNTQNLFRYIVGRAESRGMVVNTDKTNLLVVSDVLSYDPEAYIEDAEGNEITGGDSLKILGFTFSGRPTVSAHVDALRRKFRQRYWILIHLRNFGFSEVDLAKVYRTIVRPVADYACVVYHSLLTDDQDEILDRCQAHALRCIYGMGISYSEMRRRANVTTLRKRREDFCDKFAAACLKNPRFRDWFPLREARSSGRRGVAEKYMEFYARCDRQKNTPLFYMRRRLNGKAGKMYGARNAERRENDYVGGTRTDAWK